MTDRIQEGDISVAGALHDFIQNEVLPGTGIETNAVWSAVSRIVHEFGPRNRDLLAGRDELQKKIDAWHLERRGKPHGAPAYRAFLEEIGYIVPEGGDFTVDAANVDEEIKAVAGPQLVVPISNAPYAVNPANARWGSLYDALYGTDALREPPRPGGYDPARGARVIAFARDFLDRHFPLAAGSHADVRGYHVADGRLVARLEGTDAVMGLAAPDQFRGFRGDSAAPDGVLLRHNGLHVEIVIDTDHPIGRGDPAGVADLVVESALTTIYDLEDSVATVDPEDKVHCYRNWLGLMRGTLSDTFEKAGRTVHRAMAEDRTFIAPGGGTLTLHGRSLLLARNVGHLMEDASVLDRSGRAAMEGMLDGIVTSLIALHPPGCPHRRPRRCTTTRSTGARARPSSPAASAPASTTSSPRPSPTAPTGPGNRSRANSRTTPRGTLGDVVRWVEQGVGCSKVPDINDVGLMEDRVTLRISSQHMANWLHHGVCTREQVLETMNRMAAIVHKRNDGDPAYRPMAPNFDDSVAFQAACDLVFKGIEQPSGYTEPLLHARRLQVKARHRTA